jgi:7-cyano-7-deazaguanine synthase
MKPSRVARRPRLAARRDNSYNAVSYLAPPTRADMPVQRIPNRPANNVVALLLSGGLDSCILLGHLLAGGRTVQPIYIRTGVAWELEETTAIRRVIGGFASKQVRELVSLEVPLDDLYADHWSIEGRGAPADDSPDEAVYLPGRNPLLLVKAAVWCQMHGVAEIALAPLASNPFPDATEEFFSTFERALSLAGAVPLRILRPFASKTKYEVMQLGRNFPLNETFSCIAPVGGLHCGRCNKCGERKVAFNVAELKDSTLYADRSHPPARQRVYL